MIKMSENVILDNQNCLCVVNGFEYNLEKLIVEANKTIPDEKLYLNRCCLYNKYFSLDVMVIPEGVKEILYIVNGKNSFIHKLYIPSSVSKIQIFVQGPVGENGNKLKIFVSENNSYYSSKNGSLYSKDFNELCFFSFSSLENIEIDERCTVIGPYVMFPIDFKKNVLKNIQEIKKNGIFSTRKRIKLPGNIKNLSDSFLWKKKLLKINRKIYFPETVESIGYLNGEKIHVAKTNEKYSSFKDCLYSKDFKILWRGNKKHLTVKKECEIVNMDNIVCDSIKFHSKVGEIYGFEHLNRNLRFNVKKENPYYSVYRGSLYTKDFNTLLHLYAEKSGNIIIHPDCKALGKNYFPCGYAFLRNVQPGIISVPNCFLDEEILSELKARVFGGNVNYSENGVEEKDFNLEDVKSNLGKNQLYLQNLFYEFGPLDKEMIFNDDLVYIGKYYNPGLKKYVPKFVSPENLNLAEDLHTVYLDGKIQVDCRMYDLIVALNKKGYKTKACCSGHLLRKEYFLSYNENKLEVIAEIVERQGRTGLSKGYIAFDEEYSDILRLFSKPRALKDAPFFYIQNKQSGCVLRFRYKATKEMQDKTIQILEESFSKI